jgi:hypothetical protein
MEHNMQEMKTVEYSWKTSSALEDNIKIPHEEVYWI